MTRAEASRKAAKNAAFVTNKIKALKRSGLTLDEARVIAHAELRRVKSLEKGEALAPAEIVVSVGSSAAVKESL